MEIIKKRIAETRRAELADEVKEAQKAFEQGEVRRGTVKDLIEDLDD